MFDLAKFLFGDLSPAGIKSESFTHQANALTVLVYSMKGYLLLPYLCLNIISEYCTFVAF